MRLLISGCARSGTTLMIHLMRYFYSCKVIIADEQHPADFIDYNSKDHVLVIKKPYLTHDNIGYFNLERLLDSGWRVIWMIRDGRDVIVSQNHHVSPERWIFTNFEMLKSIGHESILLVRYENICLNPRKEMDRIKAFVGQDYQEGFEEFYTSMQESPMNAGIVARPIDTSSIGSHQNEPEYIQNALNKDFNKLLTLFGYE